MKKYRLNTINCILFLLMTALSLFGCLHAAKTEQIDMPTFKDSEFNTETDSEFYDFILGVGDTLDITVYREKTSEFILGIGDRFDLFVHRKGSSEFILGKGDTINVSANRSDFSEFVIGKGDSLSITVNRSWASEFILGKGDSLSITVYRHSDLEKTVRIDSFGRISLPLIGDVVAEGKTAKQLRRTIKQKLEKYVVDPQVIVDVSSRINLDINDLNQNVTVDPFGKISLPLIGDIAADGKTAQELRKIIENKLKKYVVDPQVIISVSERRNLDIGDLNKSVKIDPHGKISLPILGDIQADAKTTDQLRSEIQQKLKKYFVDPQVHVSVPTRSDLNVEELTGSYLISAQTYGKVQFPIIGEVHAAGKNVIDFREEIRSRLSEYIYEPQVTVNITPISELEIDDLSLTTKIGTTGGIMMPIIGEVQAAGKSVGALRRELQKKLSEYLVSAQVMISVTSVVSQEAYVLGEVESSQTIPITKKMFVWEAIIRSGGYTEDANSGNVLLFRKEDDKLKITSLDLDIKKMIQNGNQYVKNGDVIYVPPKMIANIEQFMMRLDNILQPFLTFQRAFIFYPEFIDVLRGTTGDRSVTISP